VGFDFTGKVAAITGGASGIGLALAERLSAEGAAVAIADVDQASLGAAAARLPEALTMAVDVADAGQTDAFAIAAADRFGPVNVVCANAGIIGPAGPRLWEVAPAEWQRVIDVNLLGVVNTLRSFVPWLLRAPPGYVAITSSMAGVTSSASMPAYFATKHALVAVAETLRLQFERDQLDIGVSVLLPAQVSTNLGASLTGELGPSTGIPDYKPRELTPAEVADRFIEAVRANRLYVFTHPEAIDRVQRSCDALVGAFSAMGAPADRSAP
jgi:NAD(P)-dependent dehydrogenase (short-subunit alcohol dehydrogenase family)